MTFWKLIRVGLLLMVLGAVALDAWLTRWRTTDWDVPLRVTVHPIAADITASTLDYLARLSDADFADVGIFFAREARRHGLSINEPVRIRRGRTLAELPPLPPADRGMLGTIWWSLKLRWWSRGIAADEPSPRGQVRIFVLYYNPETTRRVSHSLGLQKGLIGIVHAYANRSQAPTNNVVLAHELLHTLGATDKYDPRTGFPQHPHGYAEPDQKPLHPQSKAELMGGRIPRAPGDAEIPVSLKSVIVGEQTAREINWLAP